MNNVNSFFSGLSNLFFNVFFIGCLFMVLIYGMVKLVQSNHELRTTVNDGQDRIEKLIAMKNASDREAREATARSSELERQVAALSEQRDEYMREATNKQKTIDDLTDENTELVKDNAELNQKTRDQEQTIQAVTDNYNQQREYLAVTTGNNEALQKELGEAKAKNTLLASDLKEERQANEVHLATNERVMEQNKEYRYMNAALKTIISLPFLLFLCLACYTLGIISQKVGHIETVSAWFRALPKNKTWLAFKSILF